MIFNKPKDNTERGVAIYLVIVIMAVLLGIGLGINALLVDQIKSLRGIGDSVIAFYAAEAGVEKILYDDSQGIVIETACDDPGDCTGILPNFASFDVVVTTGGVFELLYGIHRIF